MCEISIIIPIYNSEKYLKKCIDSVLNQTYSSYELILVDDGSSDKSGMICDEYSKISDKIRVIHKKNEGVSSARNIGIKNASGEYILFLDSDDWIENESLKKIEKLIIKYKFDVLVFGYREFYEKNNKINKISYYNINERDFEKLILDTSNNIKGFLFNKLIKKSCIKYYFDESIYVKEDLYFLLKNKENFNNIYITQEIMYNYRIRNISLSHSNKKNIKYISELKVDKYIFENNHTQYGLVYKILFVEEYFSLIFYLKSNEKKYLKDNYGSWQKKCYSEIMQSKDVNLKKKIKLIIEKHFQLLYRVNRIIKDRK